MMVIGGAALLAVLFVVMVSDRSFYTVTVTDTIDAPVEAVWRILATEYGRIHQYSEHVEAVDILSEDKYPGLGCVRYCSLTDGGYMKEEITIWKPNAELKIEIKDSSMPMVPGTSVHFILSQQANGSVGIEAIGSYRLKFVGPLSPLIAKSKYRELLQYLIDIAKQAA